MFGSDIFSSEESYLRQKAARLGEPIERVQAIPVTIKLSTIFWGVFLGEGALALVLWLIYSVMHA